MTSKNWMNRPGPLDQGEDVNNVNILLIDADPNNMTWTTDDPGLLDLGKIVNSTTSTPNITPKRETLNQRKNTEPTEPLRADPPQEPGLNNTHHHTRTTWPAS